MPKLTIDVMQKLECMASTFRVGLVIIRELVCSKCSFLAVFEDPILFQY